MASNEIVVKVDARELEEAINRAIEEFDRRVYGDKNAPEPVGFLAGAAVITGAARPVSRRRLLGLGWLKRCVS